MMHCLCIKNLAIRNSSALSKSLGKDGVYLTSCVNTMLISLCNEVADKGYGIQSAKS